jgi:hypothetical protein
VQTHATDASVTQPLDALSNVCCSSRMRQTQIRRLTPLPFATCLDCWSSPCSRSTRQTRLSRSTDAAFAPTDVVQKRLSRAGPSDASSDAPTEASVMLCHTAPKSPRAIDAATVASPASVARPPPRLTARVRPRQNPTLGYGDRRCTVASDAQGSSVCRPYLSDFATFARSV